MVYVWDGLWLCSSGWTELCNLPYLLSLGLKLKTCVIMDGLCTWGGGCTYAGTQVCSCTCGGWRPPWSIILSFHLMFWDKVAHCTRSLPTGWIGWSVVLKFSCLLLPVCDYRSEPPLFLWGPGFQSLVFIPKKGKISSPSHPFSPHGSFQYFKDVDPLFLPLHCFPRNNKEKSISCERRE